MQELVGGQTGPHAVEGVTHLGDAAQALGQILLLIGRGLVVAVETAAAEPRPVLVRQDAQHI